MSATPMFDTYEEFVEFHLEPKPDDRPLMFPNYEAYVAAATARQIELDTLRSAPALPIGPTLEVPTEPGHYVYIHHGDDSEVLYVGKTSNPLGRVANHALNAKKSPWFRRVIRIEWRRFGSTVQADWVEMQLIETLLPTWNKIGIPR